MRRPLLCFVLFTISSIGCNMPEDYFPSYSVKESSAKKRFVKYYYIKQAPTDMFLISECWAETVDIDHVKYPNDKSYRILFTVLSPSKYNFLNYQKEFDFRGGVNIKSCGIFYNIYKKIGVFNVSLPLNTLPDTLTINVIDGSVMQTKHHVVDTIGTLMFKGIGSINR